MVEYALTLKCVSAPVTIKDSTVKLVSLVRTKRCKLHRLKLH